MTEFDFDSKIETGVTSALERNVRDEESIDSHKALITNLKQRILCDNHNKILPNIIEKTFRDGSTYIGQYNPQANTKEGNGLYFYHEGDVYGGNWSNDQLNGLGVYLFANGDYY